MATKWVTVSIAAALSFALLRKLSFTIDIPLQRNSSSFGSGVLATVIVLYSPWLLKRIASLLRKSDNDSRIYGLQHGVLNLEARPASWWMNMGYWEGQKPPTNLPAACHSLLRKVLSQANLLAAPRLNVIDVGFGCGDQTLAIQDMCDVKSYIGITLDKQQYRFAKGRHLEDFSNADKGRNIHLYQADAAKPDSWPTEVKKMVTTTFQPRSRGDPTATENWLLALDTMYHFKPSRQPLLQYCYRDLHCSIAAFDLLLSDQKFSRFQLLLLRISCLLSSTPFSNLLTVQQYRNMLQTIGFQENDIQIVDISDRVFGPLAEFLDYQDQQLQVLGLGIGRFHAAKWLFSWWAKTGIVRGCIVTAKCRT